jgi:hypothetical protein
MRYGNERGLALIGVLMLALVVTTLIIGAAVVTSNSRLVATYNERQGRLQAAADAGLEEMRSAINGNRALYPESLFSVIEDGATVTDAAGQPIPGLQRWSYVGPTGVTSGQYGVFGSVVTVVRDNAGNSVVRRSEVVQESFAKYAYFTDVEPSNISFGGGDQLWGPVHTNDMLKIYSSGAWFHGTVTTASTVQGAQYGTFDQGYTTNAAYIAMPQTADLTRLQAQATAGGTSFVGDNNGAAGQATTRIEFVAIDLNGDGDTRDADEGFIRVYQSADAGWVVGSRPTDFGTNGLRNSRNCGHASNGGAHAVPGAFVVAAAHPTSGTDNWRASVTNVGKRCYLGGADELFGGFQPTTAAPNPVGRWLQWTGPVSPLLGARPDRQYLYPISRALNPSFKGVIFVQGSVAISGVLRGQVTVAATGRIVIADDVVHATDPGVAACGPNKDILGLFAGLNVIMADNTLNAPVIPDNGNNWFSYDDTPDEFVHAVVLTLNQFTVENYQSGATRAEPCGTSLWGRGCLYLTGGIIQRTRGAVGTITSPGGTGYLKRYSYDGCAGTYPPPYFPTTGRFSRGRYYEVDPTNFDVSGYFRMLTAQ